VYNKNKNKYIIMATIQRYSWRAFKNGTTIGIIGRRGSGKTTIAKNLCYYLSPQIRIPIMVCGTSTVVNDFDDIFPPIYIYDDYNAEKMRILIQAQIKVINNEDAMHGKKQYGLLFMDDIVSQEAKWRNDMQFIKMFLEGRHFKITNILSVQNPLDVPSKIRSNVDVVIITTENRTPRLKNIYEQYWPGQYGDFNFFREIFTQCTKGFKAMVIDVRAATKPNATMENSIFWIKGAPMPRIPRYRLGLRSIWELSERLFNRNWLINRYSERNEEERTRNREIILADN